MKKEDPVHRGSLHEPNIQSEIAWDQWQQQNMHSLRAKETSSEHARAKHIYIIKPTTIRTEREVRTRTFLCRLDDARTNKSRGLDGGGGDYVSARLWIYIGVGGWRRETLGKQENGSGGNLLTGYSLPSPGQPPPFSDAASFCFGQPPTSGIRRRSLFPLLNTRECDVDIYHI